MKIVGEKLVGKELLDQFKAVSSEGASLVDVAPTDTALTKITAINSLLSGDIPNMEDYWTELALPAGTLWGESLVQEFDWQWIQVDFEDGSQALGVFNKDRSMGIYPWYFILGVVENSVPSTVLLVWNMVKDGAIPNQDPNSYTNLMDVVHHIVPPI